MRLLKQEDQSAHECRSCCGRYNRHTTKTKFGVHSTGMCGEWSLMYARSHIEIRFLMSRAAICTQWCIIHPRHQHLGAFYITATTVCLQEHLQLLYKLTMNPIPAIVHYNPARGHQYHFWCVQYIIPCYHDGDHVALEHCTYCSTPFESADY